jgi:hypothetical protein
MTLRMGNSLGKTGAGKLDFLSQNTININIYIKQVAVKISLKYSG